MSQSSKQCHGCSKPYDPEHPTKWYTLQCLRTYCEPCMANIFISSTASNRVGAVFCCPQHGWTASDWKSRIHQLFDRKTAKKLLARMEELDSEAGRKVVCHNKQCGATILEVERKTETLKVEHVSIPCAVSIVKTQAAVNEKADYEYNPVKPWTPPQPTLQLAGSSDKVASLLNQSSKSDSIYCKSCWSSTCVICKGKAHAAGEDCPMDIELKETIKMAVKQGWRRCKGCHSFFGVEQGAAVGEPIHCVCLNKICSYCGVVWAPNPTGGWYPEEVARCECSKQTLLGRCVRRVFTSRKKMEEKLFMGTAAPRALNSEKA